MKFIVCALIVFVGQCYFARSAVVNPNIGYHLNKDDKEAFVILLPNVHAHTLNELRERKLMVSKFCSPSKIEEVDFTKDTDDEIKAVVSSMPNVYTDIMILNLSDDALLSLSHEEMAKHISWESSEWKSDVILGYELPNYYQYIQKLEAFAGKTVYVDEANLEGQASSDSDEEDSRNYGYE